MREAVVKAFDDLSGCCFKSAFAGRVIAGDVGPESVSTEEPCTDIVEAIGLESKGDLPSVPLGISLSLSSRYHMAALDQLQSVSRDLITHLRPLPA
jgi:hypothetical protein